MRHLLLLAAVSALALARPDTYREKEDFQYSRSSSDEGTKAGYYGAQRGNTGGNYERAHNMDVLAQHQMSGAVRQVQGELGEGANQNTGSVYTAANTRGIYGAGHFDLSNLEGRNFQEGTSFDNSHSLQSFSNRHAGQSYSSRYSNFGSSNANSRYRGYDAAANSEQLQYLNNQHSSSDLQAANQFDSTQTAHDAGYYARVGYHGQHLYDQANIDASRASNVQSRLVGTIPVKIVIRPGTKVTIPVASQQYDASQASSTLDKNSINTETEVLSNPDQSLASKPTGKFYESSYSYRKEWERHHGQPITGAGVMPLAIPTANPFPINSELYEDINSHGSTSTGHQDINTSNMYRSQTGLNVKSLSSQSSQASNSGSSAYTLSAQDASIGGGASSLNNQVEEFGSKPKSYQSSYSYHKSWERQGDPYIIKPIPSVNYDAAASQRLTTSSNAGYGSHHYGSRSSSRQQNYMANGEDCDCDEYGHARVPRSYNQEDFNQQLQKTPDHLEDLTQQTQQQWDNLDLSQMVQQTVNDEDLVQEQNWGKVEEDQQTQNKWDRLEDMGHHDETQEAQKGWDKFDVEPQNMEQQITPDTMQKEDDNQQAINKYENEKSVNGEFESQNAFDQFNIQSLGQNHEQSQDTWDTNTEPERKNYFGHDPWYQVQNTYNTNQEWIQTSAIENFPQQVQKHQIFWENENFNANSNTVNIVDHNNNQNQTVAVSSLWDKIDNIEKQSQSSNSNEENSYKKIEQLDTNLNTHNDFESTTTGHKPWYSQVITSKPNPEPVKPYVDPQDVGRGDIGPEDIIPTENTLEIRPLIINKPHEVIENLNVVKDERNKEKASTEPSRENEWNKILIKNNTEDELSVIKLITENKITTVKPIISTTFDRNIFEEDQNTNVGNGYFSNYGGLQNEKVELHKFVHQEPHHRIEQVDLDEHNNYYYQEYLKHQQEQVEQVSQQFDQQSIQSIPILHLNENQEFLEQQQHNLWNEHIDAGNEAKLKWKALDEQKMEKFEQESLSDWQQHENIEKSNTDVWRRDSQKNNKVQISTPEPQLETFEQQSETFNQQQLPKDFNEMQINKDEVSFTPKIEEVSPIEINKEDHVQDASIVTMKSEIVDSPPEPVTEKVGFWKSVGSKLSNAKDKVASWFHRS